MVTRAPSLISLRGDDSEHLNSFWGHKHSVPDLFARLTTLHSLPLLSVPNLSPVPLIVPGGQAGRALSHHFVEDKRYVF